MRELALSTQDQRKREQICLEGLDLCQKEDNLSLAAQFEYAIGLSKLPVTETLLWSLNAERLFVQLHDNADRSRVINLLEVGESQLPIRQEFQPLRHRIHDILMQYSSDEIGEIDGLCALYHCVALDARINDEQAFCKDLGRLVRHCLNSDLDASDTQKLLAHYLYWSNKFHVKSIFRVHVGANPADLATSTLTYAQTIILIRDLIANVE